MKIVRAYLGLGSRYSYLASTQIGRIENATGVTFEWLPVNSVDLIRRSRRGGSPFDQRKLEGQYDPKFRDQDAQRWAALYEVPYHTPNMPALPSDLLATTCWSLLEAKDRRALMHAFYDALFVRDQNLTEEYVREIASGFGAEVSKSASLHHERTIHDALDLGVFGVPTFVVDGELFWGNDRLSLLVHYLQRVGRH